MISDKSENPYKETDKDAIFKILDNYASVSTDRKKR